MTNETLLPTGETCPHCDREIRDGNRAVHLEMRINGACATLVRLTKKESQGWFWWHAKCAEQSIKRGSL